ncbi:MAG: serine hydrolase domain-containing protein [Candidatus Kapaibacterium sp.]
MKILSTILILVLLFPALLSAKPSSLASKIDALLSSKTHKPFNGIVLVSQGGRTLYSQVKGISNFSTKKKLQPNSQFIIGSISKQITAVLVLHELDKDHVRLDVPIRAYLPELPDAWADTVTVDHLLTHMHGITRLGSPTAFTPGTQFDYGLADIGYRLLSQIVERTSGKSFAALSAEAFEICGMKHTFHPDVKQYKSLVNGYTESEDGSLEFDSLSFINSPAAGGFISTAEDLVRWNTALHSGELLRPKSYDLMITPKKGAVRQHPLSGPTDYGYGTTVSTKEDILQLGQTGFAPGFASMNFYFPATKTSVIILSNVVRNGDLREKFYYHSEILKLVREELGKGTKVAK